MTIEKDRHDSQQAYQQASQAMRRGDRAQARRLASLAASLDPTDEQPWLILAALAAPQAGVEYLKHALQLNPQSEAAQKGMLWALERLRQSKEAPPSEAPTLVPGASRSSTSDSSAVESTQRTRPTPPAVDPPAVEDPFTTPPTEATIRTAPIATQTTAPNDSTRPVTVRRKKSPNPIWVVVVFLVVFAGLCVAGLSFTWVVLAGNGSGGYAISALFKPTSTTTSIPLPSLTATRKVTRPPTRTFALPQTWTPTFSPTFTPSPTFTVTSTPTNTPTPKPTKTRAPTKTAVAKAGPASAQDVPVPDPVSNVSASEHWVDVDLTTQRAYAFEGQTMVREFIVSTGTWLHPTVTGQYHIYVKYRYADMRGPGYYLTNVPYVMYFYEGYGLHGTYWHNNFGHPMSHGCVNFKTSDAGWLYDWADVGTLVNIHN